MLSPRTILLAISVFAALLLSGQSAFATSYTLDGPVVITDTAGNEITLTGVSDDLGTQVLTGAAGADIFVFDVEATVGSISEITSSLLIATAVGAGYYSSDGETDPTGVSVVGGAGVFTYAPALGGTGSRLFLTFNGFVVEGSAQFMVFGPGGLSTDGNGGIIEIPPIPEPGTLALSALGLAALAATRRRRG